MRAFVSCIILSEGGFLFYSLGILFCIPGTGLQIRLSGTGLEYQDAQQHMPCPQ